MYVVTRSKGDKCLGGVGYFKSADLHCVLPKKMLLLENIMITMSKTDVVVCNHTKQMILMLLFDCSNTCTSIFNYVPLGNI